MEDRKIWFKGKIVPAEQALINVLSPTAQYGLNVFEGIRCYADANIPKQISAFRLTDHLLRLFDSCKVIGIACPYTLEELEQFFISAIRANDYRDDVLIRLTIFVDGEGSWRSDGPVEMFIAPIPKPRRDLESMSGLRACTSTWERINDRCMPPRIKAGANYINARYADMEARRLGSDLPILLGHDGKVAEGGGACLFLYRKQTLVTPPLSSSILESVTRATIIELAEDMKLKVVEREVDRTELYLADEIFLCGTAAEITPIISIDGLLVRGGLCGPVTKGLLQRYFDAVSNSAGKFSNWLTPIYELQDEDRY